jgi:Cu-Zn family superoxide dismutase
MLRITACVTVSVLLAAGCSPDGDRSDAGALNDSAQTPPATSAVADSAFAVIRNAEGRNLGTLTLKDAEAGIAVSGRLAGLAPGVHGVHLHSTGHCNPPAFDSAGSHWNPGERQHGSANPQGPHAGDLPNLEVGPDSSGMMDGTTAAGSLGGELPLLDADGAAVIVHAGTDDYQSQPSGNAGSPVACGVVEAGAGRIEAAVR